MRKYLVRIFAIASILLVVGVISLNFSFKLGIMVIVNLWIAILLHELGHAVVGKLGGLSIVRFHVGPVQLDFRTGRRRIFVLRGNPFLGVVTLDPECKSAEDAVVAYRRAIIAGSLTSFAFAIGFLWLWFVSIGTGAPHLGLHWFGFVNAVLALSIIAPGDRMDGTQFRRLKEGNPNARNLMQGYRLALSMGRPNRPRERPTDLTEIAVFLLNEPQSQLFPETKITATRFLYEYLADWGRLPEALAWLEWASGTVDWSKPTKMSNPMDVLLALRALHYALWNNDPVHAEVTLGRLHQRSWVRRSAETMMPLALIRLSRGDREGARKLVSKVRLGLENSFESPGCAGMFSEWLDIIEQRVNDNLPSPIPSAVLTHTAAD